MHFGGFLSLCQNVMLFNMRFKEFVERHFPGLEDAPAEPEKDPKQVRIKNLLARYADVQQQRETLEFWGQDRNSRVREDALRLQTLNDARAAIVKELQDLGVEPPKDLTQER